MSADFPATHDVEYELSRLLRRSRMRGLRFVEQVHPDLDYASYLLLVAIAESQEPEREGVRGSELAETVGVHKSTISRGLTTLESLELVRRVTDPSDGRARLVAVTPEAAARLAEVQSQRHETLARAIAHWETTDLDHLARLLSRLNAGLEQA